MILDEGPRALIFAFFCLAATLGGGARAAQVYPGCAVPPTTFNHIWYIDPVNGKTPAAGGNGSQIAAWNHSRASSVDQAAGLQLPDAWDGPLRPLSAEERSRGALGLPTARAVIPRAFSRAMKSC